MQWSHWFSGLMGAGPSDRLYDCLPLYHSTGGIVAPGAMLVAGGSMVIRDRFSASEFWDDVCRFDCTIFQYIGELCRYLWRAPHSPRETAHRLRLACGNGLRPDVWPGFQQRFRIPRVLDFYGAAEGSVALFNVEGEPGAIGRVPPYLAHRFRVMLVRPDPATDAPARGEHGLCIPCAVDEVGEAIAPLSAGAAESGHALRGLLQRRRHRAKDPPRRLRARGRLVPHRRLDAQGRARLLLLRRPVGRHVPLEGRERGHLRGGGGALGVPRRRPRQRLWRRGARRRRQGGHGRFGLGRRAAASRPARSLGVPAFRATRGRSSCACAARWKSPVRTSIARPISHGRVFDPRATGDALYFGDAALDSYLPLDEAVYQRIVAGSIRL